MPAPPPASNAGPGSREARSPLVEAHHHGQSIWLDNISRELLLSGELRRWVEHEGIRGVTSNPAIFEKAIARTAHYDPATRALIAQGAGDALDVFERLAVQDIQLGCDVLRSVWEASEGRDGFVSLEVSPHLAHDTEGTIAEAHRLSAAVCRENLMIKVPATPAGIPAIERLIADGIHVNVTLLFAVDAYEAVHDAYQRGLEARVARGASVSQIASVASFFVSRIDAAVSSRIAAQLRDTTDADRAARLRALEARVALANAKLAYARFLEMLADARWQALEREGAQPQRVLWASTGTKDPALPKTLYVDNLIGRHTVNTLPDATLAAFRAEGVVADALGQDPARLRAEAREVLDELAALEISLESITHELLSQGCTLFEDAFDGLLASVEGKRQALLGPRLSRGEESLGAAAEAVDDARRSWQAEGRTRRLWRHDASVFSDADEARWMGWLDLPTAASEVAIASPALREAVRRHPAGTAVVIGMGGSSLWPDVLARTFGAQAGSGDRAARRLCILDSTVPDAIEASLATLDLADCLFFVSSKSGSTIEPNALFELVHARLAAQIGPEAAGRHFVAITDPGSALETRARDLGFLGTALGLPDVGGRFSALSPFGLLPAEAMGLDPEDLLARARTMAAACAPFVTPDRNPGVGLGLALGTLARHGRDKITLTTSPELTAFTDWIEQLLAESTGKGGCGLVPIAGEPLDEPARHAADRVFVDLALDGDATQPTRAARLDALAAAGHPVIRLAIAEKQDLAQEVFRWEVATAVAGAVLGLNPFDQPDVESAKAAARSLMTASDGDEGESRLGPALELEGLRLYAPPALRPAGEAPGKDVRALLSALRASLAPGDTFAINVFLADRPRIREPLARLREAIGRKHRLATTLDFGPRYLHSTGQLQKGGPDRLAGLHLWQSAAARASAPLEIPGLGGDFDALAEAQAVGDFAVLGERGRRLIGVDVGAEPDAAIERLVGWLEEALT